MARFLQKMYPLSLYALGLILLGQYVAATFNGPGKISVKYGGALDGCLDQTMKWVVDGNCGVFMAKELSGGSKFCFPCLIVMSRRTMTGAWSSF
jgi:hypothetical protein